VRPARLEAARLRREAAEARLATSALQLDYDVAVAYGRAIAADRRAALATQAADVFARAVTTSENRLKEGDVSGYAHRRIRLEAARYAALRAGATLDRRAARVALAALVVGTADSISSSGTPEALLLTDTATTAFAAVNPDSLRLVAWRQRPELTALQREADAALADARLARRERTPIPTLTLGSKSESASGAGGLQGFVAGVTLPLPLFDRRTAAMDIAAAESRRYVAEVEATRRRISYEVAAAYDAVRAIEGELATLAPELGPEAQAALRAAEVAYTEGEITLVEWLDAVRAYHETESRYAELLGEARVRRAELERAIGFNPAPPPSPNSPRSGFDR
jgi:outer membrane protein, heavy metal efflux system